MLKSPAFVMSLLFSQNLLKIVVNLHRNIISEIIEIGTLSAVAFKQKKNYIFLQGRSSKF